MQFLKKKKKLFTPTGVQLQARVSIVRERAKINIKIWEIVVIVKKHRIKLWKYISSAERE